VLNQRMTPRVLAARSDDALRAAGLSANKLRSLRELTERCLDRRIPLRQLADMKNEAVIEALVPVFGIGRWTAEMFLIFSLGRLDVLPVGDYGLKAGIQQAHGLADLPDKATLETLTARWAPYQSIGTWYIWRSLGDVPQS
jgi:DNA-3-methyladenine glycosylase II